MSVKESDINEGRRRFMMSGTLVVSFSLFPGVKAVAQEVIADEGATVHVAKATETLAGSLKTNRLHRQGRTRHRRAHRAVANRGRRARHGAVADHVSDR
jgi:hypothetical protein